MATLKYKDENGVWQYAPSLKYKDESGVFQTKGVLKYKDAEGIWHKVRICGKGSGTGSGSDGGDYPTISTLTAGSSVYLNENGSPAEYLVVHVGLPNSTLYDSGCDGIWLLRKDILETRVWAASNVSDYKNSDIHSFLNGAFLESLGNDVQNVIKQVKIPYVNGTGSGGSIASGANGLSTKAFLLSGYEVGWTKATNSQFPVDGACLEYFDGTSTVDSKRIARLGGNDSEWGLRSPDTTSTNYAWGVNKVGNAFVRYCYGSFGVRPCMILPYTAKLDPETNTIIS